MQRQKPKSRGGPKVVEPEPVEPVQDDSTFEPDLSKFDPSQYLQRGIDPQEIVAMKECFDIFDRDKSGYIDLVEMKEFIKEMNLESNPEKILELTQNIDADKDNKIDFQEFLNLLSIYDFDYENEEQLSKIFNKFSNGKDAFTVEDFQRMTDLVGENYTPQQLENMVKFADWNGDNAIDFEAFKRVIMKEQKKIGKK
jgi:Ca2+-binding EF-hand superfamily protein